MRKDVGLIQFSSSRFSTPGGSGGSFAPLQWNSGICNIYPPAIYQLCSKKLWASVLVHKYHPLGVRTPANPNVNVTAGFIIPLKSYFSGLIYDAEFTDNPSSVVALNLYCLIFCFRLTNGRWSLRV